VIEEQAQVVALEGEEAWVETARRSSCGSCEARGCGTGALSQVLGARVQRMRVHNPIQAQPGDSVILGIEEGVLLRGSLMVYILPLLLMLGGGLLGEALAPQWGGELEALSLLFGLLGLVGGFFLLRRYQRRVARDPRFTATILRQAAPAARPITMNFSSGK
jgi:sigma-E factor negative regulatory protein RseC